MTIQCIYYAKNDINILLNNTRGYPDDFQDFGVPESSRGCNPSVDSIGSITPDRKSIVGLHTVTV